MRLASRLGYFLRSLFQVHGIPQATTEPFDRKCSGWRLRPAEGLKGRAHHVMTPRG